MNDASSTEQNSTLADDPIRSNEEDLFNRGPFADRVVELLTNVADETPSAVLGLLGPWGSGKTSALHLIRGRLDEAGEWQVVQLNPWMVADLPSLIDEFFRTLISAVPEGKEAKGQRETLAKYTSAIAAVSSPLRVVGIDIPGALEGLDGFLKGDQSLDARRKDLEKAFQSLSKPILLILDDLDRLQPDELLLILKLVRLLGRLPNTYYLLSFDERTAIDVLKQTGLAHNDSTRAVAYLEKVIQVRLDLPPLHPTRAGRLLEEALDAIVQKNGIDWPQPDQTALASAYTSYMQRFLLTPRQVKRYCAQIQAMYPLVAGEVNFTDFAIVTFLRTFHPGITAMLIENRGELTRTSLTSLHRASPNQAEEVWRDRVERAVASEADVDPLLKLLAGQFSVISSSLQGFNNAIGPGAERQGIDTDEYFDRYFYLGVSEGDVADSTVRAAIEEARSGHPREQWRLVAESVASDGSLALDKLRRFTPKDAATAGPIARHAAALGPTIPDGEFLNRPQAVWRMWMAELIGAAAPKDPTEFVGRLVDASSLLLIARVCHPKRSGSKDDGERKISEAMTELRRPITDFIREELEKQSEIPVQETTQVFELLSYWKVFEPDAEIREWLVAAIEKGPWCFPDVLGLFATVGSASGVGGRHPALGDPDLELLDCAIGLQEAFDKIGDSLEVSPQPRWGYDVSFDARLQSVFNGIANWADRPGEETQNRPTS